MATDQVVSGDISGLQPTRVGVKALAALRAQCPILSMVNRDFEDDLQQAGVTKQVPLAGSAAGGTSALLTEGNSLTFSKPVTTYATITFNKHRYDTFQVGQRAAMLAAPDVAAVEMEQKLRGMAIDIAQDLYANVASFTGGVVGAAGVALDSSDLIKASRLLDEQKPPDDMRFFVGAPVHCADVLNWDVSQAMRMTGIAGLIAAGKLPGYERLPVAGYMGDFQGIQVFKDSAIANASPSATKGILIHRDAILAAFRPFDAPEDGTGVKGKTIVIDGVSVTVLKQYLTFSPDPAKTGALANLYLIHTLYGSGVGRAALGVEVDR
jgi:hypothetical protein